MELVNGEKKHYKEILELNEELVHFLAPMDDSLLVDLIRDAVMFKVVEVEGEFAAFIIVLDESADYDSPNFLWFKEEYSEFYYVDRVVISPKFHGQGIGKVIYEDVIATAKSKGISKVTAEIDYKPANPVSLSFHKNMGFKEVGRQEVYSGAKVVSLQCCEIK